MCSCSLSNFVSVSKISLSSVNCLCCELHSQDFHILCVSGAKFHAGNIYPFEAGIICFVSGEKWIIYRGCNKRRTAWSICSQSDCRVWSVNQYGTLFLPSLLFLPEQSQLIIISAWAGMVEIERALIMAKLPTHSI